MSNTIAPINEYFTLGFAIDQLSKEASPTLAQDMLDPVKTAVSALPGWEVAWGPAVYQHEPGGVRTNGAYIAYNAQRNSYFLGLAGTDPYSFYAWIFEDLNVNKTVTFPYAGDTQISEGIHIGWQNLSAALPPAGNPGAGTLMQDWLAAQMAANPGKAELRVGGHSLGGGLTPVFTIWLKETQPSWDPEGKVSYFGAWPFAGQTPGEAAFAEYYNTTAGLEAETYRVHNDLDIVPHAFEVQTLLKIPTLYGEPDGDPTSTIYSPTVTKLVTALLVWISARDYTQQGTDMPQGSDVNTAKITQPNSTDQETLANFLRQAGWQHVDYYKDRFLVSPPGSGQSGTAEEADILACADRMLTRAAGTQ